ncbi:MAG: prepilin peptidase [bacterium]|nr:prepilin peptidase [bacterium]
MPLALELAVLTASVLLCALAPMVDPRAQLALLALLFVTLSSILLLLARLSIVDIRSRLLPTALVRPLQISFLAFNLQICAFSSVGSTPHEILGQAARVSLIGCAAMLAILLAVAFLSRGGGEAPIGGGDIRMGAAIGLGLGANSILVLAAACIIGIAYSAIARKGTFPMGPCLAAPSALLMVLSVAAAL